MSTRDRGDREETLTARRAPSDVHLDLSAVVSPTDPGQRAVKAGPPLDPDGSPVRFLSARQPESVSAFTSVLGGPRAKRDAVYSVLLLFSYRFFSVREVASRFRRRILGRFRTNFYSPPPPIASHGRSFSS